MSLVRIGIPLLLLFGAMLYGIPALIALGGAAAGWLIGRAVKKKRQSLVDATVL